MQSKRLKVLSQANGESAPADENAAENQKNNVVEFNAYRLPAFPAA